MESGTVKVSKQSQGKLDVYSELELFFPKVPVPDFDGDCKGMPTEWWFPDHGVEGTQASMARAREICDGCSVKEQCLDFALSFPNLQGMWGGLSPRQRVSERRRRYRQRMNAQGKRK